MLVEEREREIRQIVQSISDLNEVFRDLATMVVEQVIISHYSFCTLKFFCALRRKRMFYEPYVHIMGAFEYAHEERTHVLVCNRFLKVNIGLGHLTGKHFVTPSIILSSGSDFSPCSKIL